MATAYRFRVTFEDYDDVTRDIEIKSTQTFEDLHHIIQSSIGFDATKNASFYISNDNWIKGTEFSLEERKDKDGHTLVRMKDARLCDSISDPHQKFYYLSDYDAKWGFYVELYKIIPSADLNINYPVCVKAHGEAPRQYTVTPLPKTVVAEDNELEKLLTSLHTDDEMPVAEEETEDEDDTLLETEVGVDEEEIEGMSEEGEEETNGEEDEEEMSMSDDDEMHDED